jgi:prephenate dehydratase
MRTIGIQGGIASFHHEATLKLITGPVEYDFYHAATFSDLSQKLDHGLIDMAVMAVENKIAGRLTENDHLIDLYKFKILDELDLSVDLYLIAKENIPIEQLVDIYSHPVALKQCGDFFSKYPFLKAQNYHDTADAVSFVLQEKTLTSAAIAGKLAKEFHHGYFIQEKIMDIQNNWTRFYLLSK